jgi:hypothetical protein
MYSITIRPRDQQPVSEEAMRHRLRLVGLVSDKDDDPDMSWREPEEALDSAFQTSSGVLTLEKNRHLPSGIELRMDIPWSHDSVSIFVCALECLAIAWGTHSDLLGPEGEPLDLDSLHSLIRHFMDERKKHPEAQHVDTPFPAFLQNLRATTTDKTLGQWVERRPDRNQG